MFTLQTGNRNRASSLLRRREWMRVGGLSSIGLTLPQLIQAEDLASESVRETSFGKAKACILCFMFGGQPHQDLFDLKPQAVSEIRGECLPIASSVAGIQLGELIPQVAANAHRLALVRSVTHVDSTHTIAMHNMMTGYRHRRPQSNPMNAPDDFPCFGSVVQKLVTSRGVLPSGISLNAPGNEIPLGHIFPGYFAGFLGAAYDPMFVTDDPADSSFAPLRTIEVDKAGLDNRASLLAQLDRMRETLRFENAIETTDRFQQKALHLVSSRDARAAFDLTTEPVKLRERYGYSSFGQGCLLARRLVEAGVKLVTVNWARNYQPKIADHWDTHAKHFYWLRHRLCPAFDAGLSTLLEDLEQRGMLGDTLVVVMGEFGRTPQINKDAGRDHWPGCNSILFAGGGITGGQVWGASDSIAAYPASDPVEPQDVAATIYHALGIRLETELIDHSGRPMPLCTGEPMLRLFA